jgi:cellulose synthase/poly-beta-1,6-N-acetylglucosamine synthase-like glycosyltransferase
MSTKLFYKNIYNDCGNIIYSITIPVYNQENIIVENLESIINTTKDTFEIIIILDFCFDNTEKNLMLFLNNYENKINNFIQITIYKNEDKPLFETKCDNIGFKNSVGTYCLEIQADMKMTEIGYNLHLTKPFILFKNIIAVSGRCCLGLYNVENGIGKMGADIEKSIDSLNICKNKFYVHETCIRGPLLIDRKKLQELNFLDEEEYFLDFSDQDLLARAYLLKKYICGYVPIDFYAPIQFGSTRNNTNYNCEEYIINQNEKKILQNKCNNKLGKKKYKYVWKNRTKILTYNI